MYVFCGPFINITVLLYASYHMDSFGWGKTRQVVAEDPATVTDKASSPEDEQVDVDISSAEKLSDPIAVGRVPASPAIEVISGVNDPPQQPSGTTSTSTSNFGGSSFQSSSVPDDITMPSSISFPLHNDTERFAGLEHEAQPATRALDVVAVLGADPNNDNLLDRFGRHYRTIAFDVSEKEADRLRVRFSGAAYTIEITSDEDRLAVVDAFILKFDPRPTVDSLETDAEAETDLPSHYEHLNALLARLARLAKPGSFAVVESGPSVELRLDQLALAALEDAGIVYGFATSVARSSVDPSNQQRQHVEELSSKTIVATSQRACDMIGEIYQRTGLDVRMVITGDGEQHCDCHN